MNCLTTQPACNVAALRPGDIGFYYAPKQSRQHRTLKQWLISAGQIYGHATHPGRGGHSRILHTYIVLQTFPAQGRIRIADAARDRQGRFGVGESYYDFTRPGPRNPGGTHLFYRFNDDRLARGVRCRAASWASRPTANFSDLRAALAPFCNWNIFAGARRHIRHLMAHAPTAGLVPDLHGSGAYPLMCSNFVSSVCVPEVMALYCHDRRLPQTVHACSLLGLKEGSAGHIFDCDPRWMLPSTLQAQLDTSDAATWVGWMPT